MDWNVEKNLLHSYNIKSLIEVEELAPQAFFFFYYSLIFKKLS